MSVRFTVLASGSAGNATLIEANGFGLLLDAGLGPRQLAGRLASAGASWQSIHAVLLTHTHTDHWHERTLGHLHRRRILIYCHADHGAWLQDNSPTFAELKAASLVNFYEEERELIFAPSLRCQPVELKHDGTTFGFRLEATLESHDRSCAIGYAADLGSWDRKLADALSDVDLLALEFNHDVDMEYASGRAPPLIARVLGERGHLSNEQAANLLREVLRLSTPGRLQHVVQLHLSRDCNRPSLAAAAAQQLLKEQLHPIELHTASQHRPGLVLLVAGNAMSSALPQRLRTPAQAWLPGLGT